MICEDPRWVLHVDDHCIVVNKPSGLPSVPGRVLSDCAASRVMTQWVDAKVVHRLDMDTSGLLIFGRGLEAQRALSRAFERRQVHKCYEALVRGVPTQTSGTIDLPLIPDWPNRPRQRVDPEHGKPSVTHWRILDVMDAKDDKNKITRLELTPVTGRSHQLRVHLAAIGHPILGDPLYAPLEVQAQSTRLCLHAKRLGLAHPAHGEPVVFECEVPF